MLSPNALPMNDYKNLSKFCLFSYLKEESCYDIDAHINLITIDRNDYLYRPPMDNTQIYEIVQGAVKLGSHTHAGEEFVHDVISTGDYFGNLKYLNNQFFEYSKVLIDSKVRCYDRDFFKQIIIGDPVIAEWFISYVVKRWCMAEKKISLIKEKDPRKKLKFLRSYFNVMVSDWHGDKTLLYKLLTQKELGDFAGVTRQTISLAQRDCYYSFSDSIPG